MSSNFSRKWRAHLLYNILFSAIAGLIVIVVFWGLGKDDIIFIHDELLFLSFDEIINNAYLQNPVDLGTVNSLTLIANFFERLFYWASFSFGIGTQTALKFQFFLKFFLLLSVPFYGFRRLFILYVQENHDLVALMLALWYCFNTYSVIFWNGNAFSLTFVVAYVVAPLALYYFHISVLNNGNIYQKYITSILFLFMSFSLYSFAVFVIFIFLYSMLVIILEHIKIITTIKSFAIFALLSLPLFLTHIAIFYDFFLNARETVNVSGGETYGNLQGGLLYPILMWFSWGIYTYWEPRAVFTFYKYYQTIPSLVAPFVVYFLIFLGFLRARKQ